MDELKIKSKVLTAIISKFVTRALRKKLGKDIEIKLNEVTANVVDGKIVCHIDASCKFDQSELANLLKD